jgi:threonine dehydratase
MGLVDYSDVVKAADRLRGVATRTGLLQSVELDRITGGQVFIKPECLQKTGSFKFRGAYNCLSQIPNDQKAKGVVAFSSGNHAQGVALAANLLGLPATILMPKDAPKIKISRTRSHGANVVLFDRLTQSREEMAAKIAADTGAVLIKPYDNENIIAGQGTSGLEVIEDLGDLNITLDSYLVPTSGGGLLAGNSLVFDHYSPQTKIYSAEPELYNDHLKSFVAGKRVAIDMDAGTSICDALQVDIPGEITFEINKNRVAGGISASDAEAVEAMRFALDYLNLVVEPSGAVALAALLNGKVDAKNKNIGIILSGGNVDGDDLLALLGG